LSQLTGGQVQSLPHLYVYYISVPPPPPSPSVPQAGTLKVGDVVAAGAAHGKVRTLSNAAGAAISSAGPSIAVQLIGLNAVPQAGDEFQVRLWALLYSCTRHPPSTPPPSTLRRVLGGCGVYCCVLLCGRWGGGQGARGLCSLHYS